MGKFGINKLEFFKIQVFEQKQKLLIFGTKCFTWVILTVYLKNYCHVWNYHSRICEISKFHPEQKNIKIGPENAFLDKVRPKFENKVLSYLRSASSNCEYGKFHVK